MLLTKPRITRNSYFHFHPLHALFSLITAAILMGMLAWFLAVPAR
jgi:predicted PurR-regulated permease PerM